MTSTDQLRVTRTYPDGQVPVLGYRVRLAEGFTPSDHKTYTQRSLLVEPMVHPRLEEVFASHTGRDWREGRENELRQVSRTGRFSFSFSSGAFERVEPLTDAIRTMRPNSFFLERDLMAQRQGQPVGLRPYESLLGRPSFAAHLTRYYRSEHHRDWWTMERVLGPGRTSARPHEALFGAVSVTESHMGIVYLRVVTFYPDRLYAAEGFSVDPDIRVPLDLALPNRVVDAKPVFPVAAVTAVEMLDDLGVPVFFEEDFSEVRAKLRRSVSVYPAPGRPAEAQMTFPRTVSTQVGGADTALRSWPKASLFTKRVSATDLSGLTQDTGRDLEWIVDPQVDDIISMVQAVAVEDTPVEGLSLRDYQRQAVGLHLSTRFGYLNALEAGMGKTGCALDAMRRRADSISSYRGLVVCEANVRAQWAGETTRWFPSARVIQVSSTAALTELTEALRSTDPVVVITSYALARSVLDAVPQPTDNSEDTETLSEDSAAFAPPTSIAGQLGLFETAAVSEPSEPTDPTLGHLLAATHWHDLIADEGALLKNTGSEQSKALWALRENADVAVALTGTPVTRTGVDDLARIIAWTRGSRDLFYGHKLSDNFDVSKESDLHDLVDALGPTFFRRNKSDIADELVMVDAEVVRLEPHPAEKEVVTRAVAHLKQVLDELLALLELVSDLPEEDREQYREELRTARSALLGSSTVARRAASHPATLLESNSAAAALLTETGLVDAAVRAGSTKLRWVSARCSELASSGRQALVFTEFAGAARKIEEALTAAGLRVGMVIGGGGRTRDRHIEEFREGQLDVLVCTASGKRGLNLQTASAIIHYDLPWTPDDVAQRNARVERIGATADEVKVYYLTLAGTIEERVLALVAARSAEAVRILDVSRGADASGTDMGRIFAAIHSQVDDSVLSDRDASLVEVTRALVAA